MTQVLVSCLWRKAMPFPDALCHVSYASGVVLPSGTLNLLLRPLLVGKRTLMRSMARPDRPYHPQLNVHSVDTAQFTGKFGVSGIAGPEAFAHLAPAHMPLCGKGGALATS